jgi:hypothetical protein
MDARILGTALTVLAGSVSDGMAATVTATATDMAWLAGCWAASESEQGSGEQWTAPAGGTLLGMGRRVRDGRTVSFEWLRIVETAEGSLAYLALPSGQAETRFELTVLDDQRAEFENPTHDFPQRVSYVLDGDRLQARIEGRLDGVIRAVNFPMRRVSCPGP